MKKERQEPLWYRAELAKAYSWVAMQVETKFLRLLEPVALGDRIDGWRVCWVGG